MSNEKQIEEMIEAIKKCSCVYTDCEQECSQCSNEELYDDSINHIARTIYEAGYRKQSEGVWKFNKDGSGTCSECGMTQKNVWDHDNSQRFCGCCGAKMKGGE